ncbi:hypothetical protein SESBI_17116 [Sesbania bispinosa]|nr:hypothetical protein SESBI_17116 [Sesbania bispinosa]
MSRDYVFGLDELSDSEILVVKALQAFKEKCRILGCHRILNGGGRSLKDRLGDMAGNNMLALAEKRAKREAAKKAAADAEAAVATGAGSSTLLSSQPAVAKVTQERPRKKVRTEALKGSLDSVKGEGSSTSQSALQTPFGVPSSPRISWATPDPEEDAAMKLLGQQGQRVFTGSSAAGMKDFLGQVGTWCLRGAMMAEFFHSTIDEVAALPQIKKDFEAVSKKLKDDEVMMQDALKKVKGLSDENLKLTDKNKELEEEIEKLKSALAAKRSEAIQAVIEKQKMAEDLENAMGEWKLKAAEYEKEIQRVEDLWDESAECFFHNAIDQIKFLNPGVELRTRGMSTLCVVRDAPSEAEIDPPPMQPLTLEADVVRDEKEGPTESEMVDARILGLDDNKPPKNETDKPPSAEN